MNTSYEKECEIMDKVFINEFITYRGWIHNRLVAHGHNRVMRTILQDHLENVNVYIECLKTDFGRRYGKTH